MAVPAGAYPDPLLRPHHTLSVGTGLAVAELLGQPELADEVAEFAQHARERLHLDNAAVSATMMVAQQLVTTWSPHWRYAYAVAVSLGLKLVCNERPFLIDIVHHLTDEFTLQQLLSGENAAVELTVELCDFGSMNMLYSFRTALINMVLEEAPPLPPFPVGGGSDPFHVLVVDCSADVCAQHRERLSAYVSSSHAVQSVEAAIAHLRERSEAGEQVHLVLLDFALDPDAAGEVTVAQALDGPNGFDICDNIAAETEVRIDFCIKPFVAMVTERFEELQAHARQQGWYAHDRSLRGCQTLLPKPFTLSMARTLVEGTAL